MIWFVFFLVTECTIAVLANPFEDFDYQPSEINIKKLGPPLNDPEQYMGTMEIIKHYGYPAEKYNVTTSDDYILEIHRIPKSDGIPVLLMHGLFCTSTVWVDNTAENSLGFFLSDKGYDVWMGNIRGNKYSRNHATLKAYSVEFWDFCFDDHALKDVPAIINFIINTTQHNKIFYIGHSLGTAEIFALLSSKPEYNEKVIGILAMAPIATIGNMKSPIVKAIAPYAETIKLSMELIDMYEIFGETMAKNMMESFCKGNKRNLKKCITLISDVVGQDVDQFNMSRLNVYTAHIPSASSLKNVYQMAQWFHSKKFCAYDYESSNLNQAAYKTDTPPEYDLTKVKAPVSLFWGENDWLSVPADVDWLAKQLPNLYLNYNIPYKQFNHIDFVWAKDVKKLLYYKLAETMEGMKMNNSS